MNRAATLLAGALMMTWPAIASAQTDFSTLTLRAGYKVFVFSAGGQTSGSLVHLSASQVILDNGAVFTVNDVLRIDRGGDSLKNGAIIGAIVLGGLAAFSCCRFPDHRSHVDRGYS